MPDNILDTFDFDSFDFDSFDSVDTGMKVNQAISATPDVQNIVTSLRRRAMVVFFVIDISGSMRGSRIGAVNDAIRNVLPELKKRERSNTSAEIQIAILEFSTKPNWRTIAPCPVFEFIYEDIANVGGGTNYGVAFSALNDKLSSRQFMNSVAGAYTPLIIFMTDGKPSDMGLYPEELEKLKKNKWYQYATRAGIAIEEGALSDDCKRVLREFTGNDANVYEAKNTLVLAKQIELVTLVGVDFVTQQGSLQNNKTNETPSTASTFTSGYTDDIQSQVQTPTNNVASAPQANASPSLPLTDIDWENDFNF